MKEIKQEEIKSLFPVMQFKEFLIAEYLNHNLTVHCVWFTFSLFSWFLFTYTYIEVLIHSFPYGHILQDDFQTFFPFDNTELPNLQSLKWPTTLL